LDFTRLQETLKFGVALRVRLTGKGKPAVVDPHVDHMDDYLAVAHQAGSPIVASNTVSKDWMNFES